jgi:hypothetical protein
MFKLREAGKTMERYVIAVILIIVMILLIVFYNQKK